ncbi:hypothetical protein INR49_007629, partial [Caranx melampygus]
GIKGELVPLTKPPLHMMTADGKSEQQRRAAHWLLEREALVKTSIRSKVELAAAPSPPSNQRKVCLLRFPLALETSRRATVNGQDGSALCLRWDAHNKGQRTESLSFKKKQQKNTVIFSVTVTVGLGDRARGLKWKHRQDPTLPLPQPER